MHKENFRVGIIGAGCAGLQLLYQLALQPDWGSYQVLLLDEGLPQQQSWCFWTEQPSCFDWMTDKTWQHLRFKGQGQAVQENIAPYAYHHISGDTFFSYFYQSFLPANPQVSFVQAHVKTIESYSEGFTIKSSTGSWQVQHCYSTISRCPQPAILQHFTGWYIQTREPCFDDTCATLMDFSMQLYDGVHFMYVLPFSSTSALIEATFFSPALQPGQVYEDMISTYLKDVLRMEEFTITAKEQGCIPMQTGNFKRFGTAGEVLIGGAAGMVKPTTGYAFSRIEQDSKALATFLYQGQKPRLPYKPPRFSFYDRVLLALIRKQPDLIRQIFERLFKFSRLAVVLRFLNEETTAWQEFCIFLTLPLLPFLKQAIQTLSYKDE